MGSVGWIRSDEGVTGDKVHTYPKAGTYTVSITGDFPRIYFGDPTKNERKDYDGQKLVSIEQWGSTPWLSLEAAFHGCSEMQGHANDSPNLSQTTSLRWMFDNASLFNQEIGDWDVSSVTDMVGMFDKAASFNQDIGGWNVCSVTNMESMFQGAKRFARQNLLSWQVAKVSSHDDFFKDAGPGNTPPRWAQQCIWGLDEAMLPKRAPQEARKKA